MERGRLEDCTQVFCEQLIRQEKLGLAFRQADLVNALSECLLDRREGIEFLLNSEGEIFIANGPNRRNSVRLRRDSARKEETMTGE